MTKHRLSLFVKNLIAKMLCFLIFFNFVKTLKITLKKKPHLLTLLSAGPWPEFKNILRS